MPPITGKSVVVTGGSRGIGHGLVQKLLERSNKVIATARVPADAQQLQQLAASDSNLTVAALDISQPASIAAFAAEVKKHTPHVDLLINNAGIYGQRGGLMDLTADDFIAVYNTNTVGPFLVVQHFMKQGLLGAPGSTVVNITSIMASHGDPTISSTTPGGYAYRASKAALNIINKAMVMDLTAKQIECVLMHPGYVKTDMTGGQGFVDVEDSTSGILKELVDVLLAAELDEHYGVALDFIALLHENATLANTLLQAPQSMLEVLEDALITAQERVQQSHPQQQDMGMKPNTHVRLHNLPYSLDPEASLLNPAICNLGSFHLGKLVTVRGTVVKAGPVKMFEAQKVYMCNKCKHRFILRNSSEVSTGTTNYQLPLECPSNNDASGCGKPCTGSNFIPQLGQGCTVYTNHQELRVQEQMQCLEPGSVPASISVTVQDELADCCQPGDDVEVTGIVRAQWRPLFPGARCDGTLTLHACHMRTINSLHRAVAPPPEGLAEQFRDFWQFHTSCPLKGRNKILASICPQIYGLFLVKLAVAITLIGGCPRRDDSGTHIRGECHMLLIGDPGTGKSQVMKFAARVAPRAVVTTGRGTTGAGLTVSAVKEGGAWSLEAGALVLADGGLCCIDEFESIKQADRAMIHEAMEQQTLHIAKAGMVTTLSTRTSVLGVTNPTKGAFKHGSNCGGVAATSLSGPLLSRFDIVLLLLDQHEPQWDSIVSEHVLANHQQAQQPWSRELHGWTTEELRAYVTWAKAIGQNLAMSTAAEQVLMAYYQQQRQAEERSQARTTIRMLESLVRVSQAHARLCARSCVTLQDAVMAVLVLDSSMTGSSLMGWSNALHTHFPDDPDAEYEMLERQVMHGLCLQHLLLDGDEGGSGGDGMKGCDDTEL